MHILMSAASFIHRLLSRPAPPPREIAGEVNLYFRDKAHNLLAPFTLVNLTNISAVALAALLATGKPVLIGTWFFINLLVPLTSFYTWFRTRKQTPPPISSGSLVKKLEATSLAYGFIWGSNIALFGPYLDDAGIIMLIGANMGMCAGVSSIANSLAGMTRNFSIPCLIATIFGTLYITPTPEQYATLILGVSLVIAILAATKDQYESILKLLGQTAKAERSEKQLLSIADNIPFGIQLKTDDDLMFKNSFWDMLASRSKTSNPAHQDDFFQNRETGLHEVSFTSQIIPGLGELTILKSEDSEIEHAQALQKQAEEATKLAKLREDMVHLLSKKLLQPISVLVGFASLMDSSSKVVLTDKTRSEYCDMMAAAGRSIQDLVLDLTEISDANNIDNADLRHAMDRTPVPFKEIVETAISRYESIHSDKHMHRLRLSMDTNAQAYVGDLTCMSGIMGAVISNALAFSGDHPIDVRTGIHDGHAFITVRDNGRGIPNSQLENVFQPFYKVTAYTSEVTTESSQSSGLGLYYARLLADKIGATIKLTSSSDGGTTVYILLPDYFVEPLSQDYLIKQAS